MDKTLSAIVLEVNNTFDERRPYLLVRDATGEPAHGQRLLIQGSRVKDFHVSPFNSRNGYYSVLTSDPLGPEMDGFRGIDVTITLNSSKGQPKLVARLFSAGPAVDPASLGPLSKVTFLATWFLVGFATLPRIFWQAAVLLYRLKLDMRDRPEPLVGTLGRRATSVEESLELCFSKYLEFLARQSGRPLSVKYHTSGLQSGTERVFTSSYGKGAKRGEVSELRILTPAFYSRFVQYENDMDAVTTELNIHKTIWVDNPQLLLCIFGNMSIAPRPMSFADRLFASLLRKLRHRPTRSTLDSALQDASLTCRVMVKPKDRLSTMDAYIMLHESEELKWRYQWATFRQLVADRYFAGRIGLLDRIADMVRVGIAWACIKLLAQITEVGGSRGV